MATSPTIAPSDATELRSDKPTPTPEDVISEASSHATVPHHSRQVASKRCKVRVRQRRPPHRSPSADLASRSSSTAETALTTARRARAKMSLASPLGAGRIDPFNVYHERNPPAFVHEIIDHALHSATKAWLPSEKVSDFNLARSVVMENMMTRPLVWYSAIMSTISHHAFVRGQKVMPSEHEIVRLSYRTKTLALLQEDITQHGGVPSEQGMLAISTLIVHGGSPKDGDRFVYDDFNARKAFGPANDMNYYTSVALESSHWPALARFVRQRGGAANVKLAPMAFVFAIGDSCIAWRTLSKPTMDPLVPTLAWIASADHKTDSVATAQEKRYLSALSDQFKTCDVEPYSELYECLQNTRTTIVRYNQYQRRFTHHTLRPDVRHIHLTRILIMHDLLRLPILTAGMSDADTLYEVIRHSLFAFMQLVLFPIASNNNMPSRLLAMIVPLLHVALSRMQNQEHHSDKTNPTLGRSATIGVVDSNVFLWAWMLAGMLALETLQTKGKSGWMEELAPFIENVAIKAEKSAWPMVKGVMDTFLWLDSECDSMGQQWWNYACLSLAAKRGS